MELSSTSKNAKFYMWFYNESLPTDLCPYLWALLFAYVYTIIFGVFIIPAMIFEKLLDEESEGAIVRTLTGTVLLGILLICFSMIYSISMLWTGFVDNPFCAIGFTSWIVTLVSFVVWFTQSIAKRYKKKHKEKTPNILVEFIKAKKKKYCPTITWK